MTESNLNVTIIKMKEYSVKEFIKEKRSPFHEWFKKLDSLTANKITTAVYRLQYGNFSNVKSVGGGVSECKINFSHGYRIYFGIEEDMLVILLCGGTKKMQQNDIDKAKMFWQEYKANKKKEV